MIRAWAVIFAIVVLAGCRTSEPTNPFLRTTVPPPATTPGVVVTPGTPYAQGISPPMVTTPAPSTVTAPPPVTTQAVPVNPAPVAPAPVTAPPPVVPQGDRFNPPGGSYMYHQSTHESPAAKAQKDAIQLASATKSDRIVVQACYAPPDEQLPTVMSADGFIENPYVVRRRKIQNPNAISRDGYIENPYVKPKVQGEPAAPIVESKPTLQSAPVARPPAVQQRDVATVTPPKRLPPPRTTARRAPSQQPVKRITLGQAREAAPNFPDKVRVSAKDSGNLVRILGESQTHGEPSKVVTAGATAPSTSQSMRAETPASADAPVLRITAGSAQPALRTTVQTSASDRDADVALVAASERPGTTATFVAPQKRSDGVVQATFAPQSEERPAAQYGYARDYHELRGRLEYSQSQRQWKLRYIPIDGQTDRFGGSVILPADSLDERLQPGDFVTIKGQLADPSSTDSTFAPLYKPASVQVQSR